MKTMLALLSLITAWTGVASAQPPEPTTDLRKTLSAAAQQHKLAFLLFGRPTCGDCNTTKGMIRDGKISVTAVDYVMADLNIDDSKIEIELMRKYGRENFGETLPFVVVTDSKGKALAFSSGLKSAGQWNTLLAEAKGKAKATAASVGSTTKTVAGGTNSSRPLKAPAAK